MLRTTAALSLGLVMLMPTVVSASPVSAASEQRAGAATTTSRDVSLGHRPVVVSSRARVRLTFEGRKGRLVNLATSAEGKTCGARILRTAGGRTVLPWAKGYWRLPRTGTFTAVSKPCPSATGRVRVQVRAVVREDAAVPGVTAVAGRNRRVTHLVPVRVGAGEDVRLVVESTSGAEVIAPDRTVTRAEGEVVLTGAGTRWVSLAPRTTLETSLTVRHAATVDGDAIAIPARGTADTQHDVAFTATAGQWVYAELLDAGGAVAADTSRDIRVFGPDGTEVQTALLHDCDQTYVNDGCTLRGPWWLPTAGDHRMVLSADRPAVERDSTLRVRAAVVAPELTANGPAVTYTAATPGQWVVGRVPNTRNVLVDLPGGGQTSPGTLTYLEAANASPVLGAWDVTMATMFPFYNLYCGWDKACEYASIHLDPTRPRAMTPHYSPGWREEPTPGFTVLVVPPDAYGSVDLTVTRETLP